MDQRGGRAGPLWKSGNMVSEGSVVDLVDQDPEERCGLVTRVGLELRVDRNNERGGNSRK